VATVVCRDSFRSVTARPEGSPPLVDAIPPAAASQGSWTALAFHVSVKHGDEDEVERTATICSSCR
jgi:hypothetical protein